MTYQAPGPVPGSCPQARIACAAAPYSTARPCKLDIVCKVCGACRTVSCPCHTCILRIPTLCKGCIFLSSQESRAIKPWMCTLIADKRTHGMTGKSFFAHAQVPGCSITLEHSRPYFKNRRVCEAHVKACSVAINGMPQRFCSQCSRQGLACMAYKVCLFVPAAGAQHIML